MGENLPLLKWTKQATAPVFIYDEERPRSIWNDQLYLAERLQPNPPLIPADIGERVLMFGLANELCGENGLGWARRLMIIHASLSDPATSEGAKKGTRFLGAKYDYSEQGAEAAPARVAQILTTFNRQLEAQRKRGSRFLVGDHLSAVDRTGRCSRRCCTVAGQPVPDASGISQDVRLQGSGGQRGGGSATLRASRFHLSRVSRTAGRYVAIFGARYRF